MASCPSITLVTFAHAFRLAGHPEAFPPGAYRVLIEDERLEGLSFEAFRRIATHLMVEGGGGSSELRATTQADLDAALERDLTPQVLPPGGKALVVPGVEPPSRRSWPVPDKEDRR